MLLTDLRELTTVFSTPYAIDNLHFQQNSWGKKLEQSGFRRQWSKINWTVNIQVPLSRRFAVKERQCFFFSEGGSEIVLFCNDEKY